MQLRTITGRLLNSQGQPRINAPIVIKLMGNTYVGAETIPADYFKITTNATGDFSVDLWCNAEGVHPTKYLCGLSNTDVFYFVVAPGAPIDINQLRSTEIVDNTTIATIENLLDDRLANYVLKSELPAGGDRTYRHVQNVASSEWAVTHDMNKYPAVTIRTSGGEEVEGYVEHTSTNTLIVRFSSAFGGELSCN